MPAAIRDAYSSIPSRARRYQLRNRTEGLCQGCGVASADKVLCRDCTTKIITYQNRTPIKARRSKLRKGRVVDKAFLAFVASQPCLVSGRRPATVHHVRQYGSPKNDRRTVPLLAEFHMHDFGPTSVERLGKAEFERVHGVDLEGAILRLNKEYDEGFTAKHPPDIDLEF